MFEELRVVAALLVDPSARQSQKGLQESLDD
jgi:hypothetical protein